MDEKKIQEFIEYWQTRGNEKSDTQKFWLDFLHCVCGLEDPGKSIEFERSVQRGEHTGFIDAYIKSTGIIIEQKSSHVSLDKPGENGLTPFAQAKSYYDWLPHSERGGFIIVSNFKEIRVHDMELPMGKPESFLLKDLAKDFEKFLFLIDKKHESPKAKREFELSIEAGRLIGKLYNELRVRYIDPNDKKSLESLNILCVRIVFLLYAEDSGLFKKKQFFNYLKAHEKYPRDAIKELFKILDQDVSQRDPYIEEEELKNFPYVDGELFKDKNNKEIEIPQLDGLPTQIILNEMSEGFDWSGISPTIFGAIFEATLNPVTRRTGGMHYTSIENIHKVIDPLFLDELKKQLAELLVECQQSSPQDSQQKLIAFQNKLAALRFLDPACGSGNFLTESFKCLRKLENRVISELAQLGKKVQIKVSITQFHGIEVHDFAVAVARTALWIADNQMLKETKELSELNQNALPLKFYNHIKEGSAMSTLPGLDEGWTESGWNVPHEDMLYIMGNPPFLGYSQQSPGQKEEAKKICKNGKIDYVACWFTIASGLMYKDKKIKAAFVTTNSITQGEQVSAVFKPLVEGFNIHIDFAWQTFKWHSETPKNAQVHVVIIGFSSGDDDGKNKRLYTSNGVKLVPHINFYLIDAPDVFIEARPKPLDPSTPEMMLGNLPRDGGNLILTAEEKKELLKKCPEAEKFIREYIGADEFINGTKRYCLWLVDAEPHEIRDCKLIMERVKAVEKFRRASTRAATRNLAYTSWLFAEIRQPNSNYIAFPLTSSENRKYIPIGWLDASVIVSNAVSIIPGATLYHFGILTSRVHMAWTRRTAGRLKSDYRYSNTIVYNNFPWPSPSPKQRKEIEQTAQEILNARAKYPSSSFADLYNDSIMPPELHKAHSANDQAVLAAYNFSVAMTDEEIVAALMELYTKQI